MNVYYAVLKIYGEKFEVRYGQKFFPQPHHFKDAKALMTVPEGFEPPTMDEVSERLKTYFEQNDDWLISCRHNFSVFVKHFHRWINPNRVNKQVKLWKCKCGAEIPESDQYSHECEFRKPASAETVHKVVQEIKSLGDQLKVK